MYAGEDGEVCVELGYVGKGIGASKGNQPEKSKAGGWPVSSQQQGKKTHGTVRLTARAQPHSS